MALLNAIKYYHSRGGIRAIFALIQGKLFRSNPEFELKIPGLKHAVWLRVSTSDAQIFEQVVTNEEYGLPYYGVPDVIIDAGANVGYASVFFANRYPRARILAIEPAESNFRMLVKNAAPYGNIIPIHAALWCVEGKVAISGLEHGYWGFRVSDARESLKELVPAVTVESLINQYEIGFIDLLKIDIEGAEKEVLENSSTWIGKVGAIAIETHDRFKVGCTEALELAAVPFPFRHVKGEVQYLARTAP